MKSNKTKSLEQLENDFWGEPEEGSFLIQECHRLRTVPIGEMTVENLRILIGQNMGLAYLVPIALSILEQNPWAEGDYYPGDLLKSVVSVEKKYWSEHQDEMMQLSTVIDEIKYRLKLFYDEIEPKWLEIFNT